MAVEAARQHVAAEVERIVTGGGRSVSQVARDMKVERSTVYRWLNGRIPADTLAALALTTGEVVRLGGADVPEPAWVDGAVRRAVRSVRGALLDPEISDDEAERVAYLFGRIATIAMQKGFLPPLPAAGARAAGDQHDDGEAQAAAQRRRPLVRGSRR